ncbi:MAG: type II toxin-antitoxin system VapC family toxin [Asticcacaulis sp.]
MIVVDTSAIVALLQDEPESAHFLACLNVADQVIISAASLLETRMVLYPRNPILLDKLMTLLFTLNARVEPVTATQSDIAFDAFRRYGKGSGHPAGLNFGDCFAYALARERGAALLFKGDDFVHTDVVAAA